MRDVYGTVLPAYNKPAPSLPDYCSSMNTEDPGRLETLQYNVSNVLAASNRIMSGFYLARNATENGPHVPADICEKCSDYPLYSGQSLHHYLFNSWTHRVVLVSFWLSVGVWFIIAALLGSITTASPPPPGATPERVMAKRHFCECVKRIICAWSNGF